MGAHLKVGVDNQLKEVEFRIDKANSAIALHFVKADGTDGAVVVLSKDRIIPFILKLKRLHDQLAH